MHKDVSVEYKQNVLSVAATYSSTKASIKRESARKAGDSKSLVTTEIRRKDNDKYTYTKCKCIKDTDSVRRILSFTGSYGSWFLRSGKVIL